VTDQTEKPDAPPPRVSVGRLDSLRSVRREMAKLYRALRNGEVTPRIAGTAGYLLTGIGKVLEVELLERRLTALEDRVAVGSNSNEKGDLHGHRQH
jgi:hypothetical protein